MRKARAMAYWIVLSLLFPLSSAGAGLTVKSHSSQYYWIIRQDIFDNLPASNLNARYRLIDRESSPYGPHAIDGSAANVKPDASFWVFPGCPPHGRMKAQQRKLVRASGPRPIVWVEC